MTLGHTIAAIVVMAIVTFLTRALPFLLFGKQTNIPRTVVYLGKYLPPAVIAMLVVYCLRIVSFSAPSGWLPSLIAVAVVIALHLWKKNNLLSILGGTAVYMILLQTIF